MYTDIADSVYLLVTEICFSQKHLPGVLKRKKKLGGGGEAKNVEVFFPY